MTEKTALRFIEAVEDLKRIFPIAKEKKSKPNKEDRINALTEKRRLKYLKKNLSK